VFDFASLEKDLESAGLADWQLPISTLLRQNLRDGAHGNLADWRSILQELPEIAVDSVELDYPTVRAVANHVSAEAQAILHRLLLSLIPWRKGPFEICGVGIDCEWRSDWKWERIARHMSPLRDRLVLDVGCGNGYYALRMKGQAARLTIGIDPTLQFVTQFQAIQRYLRQAHVHVLPLRLADLPSRSHAFDTTFSMGVLYHKRNPQEHLRQLHGTLRVGGELILETLIVPGEELLAIMPDERYARMRNVWQLPTVPLLKSWADDAGFGECRVVDVNETTTDEQRTTEWMPFESLQQGLDPRNPGLTVEGLPRPIRALLVAQALT
jgi:tRNA (mo5U34)-methyltransferase